MYVLENVEDTVSTHPASTEVPLSLDPLNVYVSPFRRFYRPSPETHSLDTSVGSVFGIGLASAGRWQIQGSFGTKSGRVCTWNLSNPWPVSWGVYTVRTVAPSGAYDWVALQAENEVRPHGVANWLSEALARISSFRQLQPKWDGYRGKPPDKLTCSRAVSVAASIAGFCSAAGLCFADPPFIAPLSSGGVLFEIRNRNRELQLGIEPSDPNHFDALKVITNPSGDEVEEEARIPESNLLEVLSWVLLPG